MTMARAFAVQKRYLEASLTALRGLERHGRDASAEATPETLAELLDSTIRAYVQATKGTPGGSRSERGEPVGGMLKA